MPFSLFIRIKSSRINLIYLIIKNLLSKKKRKYKSKIKKSFSRFFSGSFLIYLNKFHKNKITSKPYLIIKNLLHEKINQKPKYILKKNGYLYHILEWTNTRQKKKVNQETKKPRNQEIFSWIVPQRTLWTRRDTLSLTGISAPTSIEIFDRGFSFPVFHRRAHIFLPLSVGGGGRRKIEEISPRNFSTLDQTSPPPSPPCPRWRSSSAKERKDRWIRISGAADFLITSRLLPV